MTVAMMKALHSPIPLILDALFASFPPTIFPQATLNYSYLHNFLFTLYFIPQFTPK